jgi:predicted dehydrogenase
MVKSKAINRRDFLGMSGKTIAGTAALSIIPRHVLGGAGYIPPSDKTVLAILGSGGQGNVDLQTFLKIPEVQVVAIADPNQEQDYSQFYFKIPGGTEPTRKRIDEFYGKETNGSYKACRVYSDYRELLEKEDIDAVSVATTDNLHAHASMSAMQKKKHVYCQKPLTHDIWEARQLTLAARKYGVATQMGNQGHAMESNRVVMEMLRAGAVGNVQEIHCWTDRPFWPQGQAIDRPKEIPSVPRTLDWDLWVGPAPYRPYHPAYVPFTWRGWWDFGTGSLGDMGCHIMDTAHHGLELGHPSHLIATATPQNDETYPQACIVTYYLPARGNNGPIKFVWYEGGLQPSRPLELDDRRSVPKNGTLFIGDKAKLLCSEYGQGGRLIPESAMRDFGRPPKTFRRSKEIYNDFIDGCRGGEKPVSNFDISGPLTEFVLMGNLAMKFPEQLLKWDEKLLKVTNHDDANKIVRREYRTGWQLEEIG